MTHVRIFLVITLALSTLTLLALPAAASAPAASSSAFCKPITGISEKLKDAGTNSSKFNANSFKQFASALRASAKHAPTKVKQAGQTLASF